MAFFWRKQETIEKMLQEYFDSCDKTFELFEKAIAVFMEDGQGEAFEAAVNRTHETESGADDLRRDIEYTLYGKALLPESRGDLLGLLETYDLLPNIAETILFTLRCQLMVVPAEFVESFKRLVAINLQAYYGVRKAVDNLFHNPKVTLHSSKEVDSKESESDRTERDMICRLFSSSMETGEKILLRDLFLLIGTISDRAQATADRVGIIAIKRQV